MINTSYHIFLYIFLPFSLPFLLTASNPHHTIFVFLPVTSRKNGEDELPVGQAQQQPVRHVLREQEGSFLRAGRTEVKRLTAKRTEIFIFAFRIGELNTRNSLGVVSAENEFLHYFCDPLDSKVAIDHGIFLFVLFGEALEVFLEQELHGTDSPLPIGRLLGRGKLEG